MNSKSKVAYFTNLAPHYRSKLWWLLTKDQEIDFHFFFGKAGSSGIKEMDLGDEWSTYRDRIHRLKNYRLRRVLIYQSGVISGLLSYKWNAVLVMGDMYVLSNWLISIIARLKGIPVYLWGHGIYGNEGPIKLFFRRQFLKLARANFLYGNYGKELLIRQGFPEQKLITIYNSLDYDKHVQLRNKSIDNRFYSSRNYFADNGLPILVFIGRLTPEKQLDQLIETVAKLNSQFIPINLLIIGDGSQRSQLENQSQEIHKHIHFYGSCYDEDEISRLLANADLCVSPGNVGLTAIHSLSFGTPVCTHDDMTIQMPEAEAIIPEKTGILFSKKDQNLSETIFEWLSNEKDRNTIRQECYQVIDTQYNPYVQVEIFKKHLIKATH